MKLISDLSPEERCNRFSLVLQFDTHPCAQWLNDRLMMVATILLTTVTITIINQMYLLPSYHHYHGNLVDDGDGTVVIIWCIFLVGIPQMLRRRCGSHRSELGAIMSPGSWPPKGLTSNKMSGFRLRFPTSSAAFVRTLPLNLPKFQPHLRSL